MGFVVIRVTNREGSSRKSLSDLRKAHDPCMSGSFIHKTCLATIIVASGVQCVSTSGDGQNYVDIVASHQRLLDMVLGNWHPPYGTEMKVVSLFYRGYSREYLWLQTASVLYGRRQ